MSNLTIECPRCNEADERSLGHNTCGLCECRFWVKPGGKIFSPSDAKRIPLRHDDTDSGYEPVGLGAIGTKL